MKRYFITGKKPVVTPISVSYSIMGRGQVKLSLTPDGSYSAYTSSYITENMIKRDSSFKRNVLELSRQMVAAYDKELASYTSMHTKLQRIAIQPKAAYISSLNRLKLKKYQRAPFTLEFPTDMEIKSDIENEAKAVLFNAPDKDPKRIQEYVIQNFKEVKDKRIANWNEAKALFEKIEEAKEQKQNLIYQREYDDKRHQKEAVINGEDYVVHGEMEATIQSIDTPIDLILQYKYLQKESTLEIEVEPQYAIQVPLKKPSILSSGKLSLKDKLQRELVNETTNTTFSLIYYLAWKFFMVSPNFDHIKITMWETGRQQVLLWVDFDRATFTENVSRKVVLPIADIRDYNYPHVFNLAQWNSVPKLSPIPKEEFMRLKEAEISMDRKPGIKSSLDDNWFTNY